MHSITLGALDFCLITVDGGARESISQTLELAPLLESFGYASYWLGEHHGPNIAHSCPEILIPVVAGLTEKMHVGSAGILLGLHSPLKIAKTFRLLETLYPDRIDLGIANGTNSLQKELLRDGAPLGVDFAKRVEELLSYIRGSATTPVTPFCESPQAWLLGGSGANVELAARLGIGYCLASFLLYDDANLNAIISTYRDNFRPSKECPEPKCCIAIAGVCAASDDAAQKILATSCSRVPLLVRPTLIGSAKSCSKILDKIVERTGIRHFVFLDISESFEDRVASFRLLAEEVLRPDPNTKNDAA